MEFTPEQREEIYLEEKAKREGPKRSNTGLLVVAVAAAVGFAAMLLLARKSARGVMLEDLRKAYDGLSPEEEQ